MKNFLQKLKRIFFFSIIFFFSSTILITILYRFVPVAITPLMIKRCFEQAFDDKREVRLQKDWVGINEMSEELPLAVIASEDQLFLEHYGFDINAIKKPLKYNNKKKGKKVKGASTISQQTAKNVFLWEGRNWIRKGLEVYFTGLIELFWSKERILEVYLNVIEMGDGVYGAQAASQYYFNKDASQLTTKEAASIAAILPLPLKWSASKPNERVAAKIIWIQEQMKHLRDNVNLE